MLEVGSTIKSIVLPGNGTGKILKKYVDRKGANGEDLYEIMDENGKIYSMVPYLFDSVVSNSVSIEQIKYEINEAIDKIIKQLDLRESNDVMDQLRNCCLVQKYIVERMRNSLMHGHIEILLNNKGEIEFIFRDKYNQREEVISIILEDLEEFLSQKCLYKDIPQKTLTFLAQR